MAVIDQINHDRSQTSGHRKINWDGGGSAASSLEFFSVNNLSLGTFFVPTANNGLSFLGVTFSDPIGRVRITTGNTAIGPNDAPGTDVVVLDDFIYSEPGVVPEPATLLLLGSGLAAATRARRKRGE